MSGEVAKGYVKRGEVAMVCDCGCVEQARLTCEAMVIDDGVGCG